MDIKLIMYDTFVALSDWSDEYAELARGIIGQGYPTIRAGYTNELYNAIMDYLQGDQSITKFRNVYRRATLTYTDAAFYTGVIDAGGNISSLPEEAREWLLSNQTAEIGHVDKMFQALKQLRASAEPGGIGLQAAAISRSEGYAHGLDAFYSMGQMYGAPGNLMLTLLGDDGMESCSTCQKYKGKRHKAQWWIDNGLVPHRGNHNYECGNWQCQHRLFTDDGQLWGA